MRLPRGSLLRRRVVADPATPLERALETTLTGYARLESQDALLLDAEGAGVLTFERGVPVVAYHTGTDSAGREALADIAVAGPHRLELYELDGDVLTEVHDTEEFRVPPGLPAQQLAGDQTLAERTREAAPEERTARSSEEDTQSAVEAFLEDEKRVAAIQERARERAREHAKQWEFGI